MTMDYQAAIVEGGSFTWLEYARLQQWNALAIPTPQQFENAVFLFTQLQPLRAQLGRPLTITSGARTPEYTRFLRSQGIPAATQSAHMDWAAVDLTCAGMTNSQLWQFCHQLWPGRMENLSATPTWVHLDTRQWGQRVRFNP